VEHSGDPDHPSEPTGIAVWCDAHDAADGGCVVEVRGELDHLGALDIGSELRWAAAHAAGRIELDCSRLQFIDTAGARLFAEIARMAAERGIGFAITSAPAGLQRLLGPMGLAETQTAGLRMQPR